MTDIRVLDCIPIARKVDKPSLAGPCNSVHVLRCLEVRTEA